MWWIVGTRTILAVCILIVIRTVHGSTERQNYTLDHLQPCSLNTLQIAQLGPDDELEPCIIFEVEPINNVSEVRDKTISTIFLVQVTPSICGNHRDGAATGVQLLNADNNGIGFAIGFNEDHYVSFNFISIVAGNPANLPTGEYDRRHAQILNSILAQTGAPYIVGTCSMYSAIEKQPAKDFSAILMAQVGPPGFYTDDNPFVFGFHINSDTYPLPNVQALGFLAQASEGPEGIPVKVIYRTKSEFFYSTCRSAIDRLRSSGFTDLEEFLYDHTEDHDGDGEINQFDNDFLLDLADQACPPGSGEVTGFHPAFFLCTSTEHDLILSRLLENGCRPTSVWVTAATWGWANNNPDKVPYFQGGGQWHAAFSYSDRFFESGKDFLRHNEDKFGYYGSYDQVVSYAIPILYSQHLQASYRVADLPDPLADFSNNDQKELLRRDMMVMNVESLFGPISFNEDQRNIGRGAAGTQWLPTDDHDGEFNNALVAPYLQAEAATFIPALSALPCDAGSFINDTMRVEQESLLAASCAQCPVDTFTPYASEESECTPCPDGSGTDKMTGASMCIASEENLIPMGMLAFGYVAVCISWLLSFTFILWQICYRSDPVVRVSQMGFLLLICIGAIISSSTVVALSFQNGTDEDTSAATVGCMVAPFLYGIGWVLQFSSLSAKTYRIYMLMEANRQMKRIKITFFQVFSVVAVSICIELIILIVWTVKSPLVYERMEVSRSIDEENHLITISSIGQCVSRDPDLPIQYFAGPLLAFHIFLVIVTNVLLYKVKDVSDRYQEQKHMAFASALIFEVLVVGIPVMVAVRNNPVATFIVAVGIIALDDIGILCLIFIPKIMFQIEGLQEGVGVGESIMKESYKKASMREDDRKRSSFSESQSVDFDLLGRSTCGRHSLRKSFIHQSIIEEGLEDMLEDESENATSTNELKDSLKDVPSQETSILRKSYDRSVYKSNTSDDQLSRESFDNEDATKVIMEDHRRLVEMTFKMMEAHQSMMRATSEMKGERAQMRRRKSSLS